MEVLHVFGFLKIVKESIKLVPKNGKMMASITILSLLLPSLLVLLVRYLEISLTKKVDEAIMVSISSSSFGLTPNQIITFHSTLFILATIAYVTALVKISSFSVLAVILVSAMSYTGEKASVADLLERVKRARANHGDPEWGKTLLLAAVFVFLINFDHNAITGAATIVACVIFFFHYRYVAVVAYLATVVAVVEERGKGVMGRAEELVVGHRLHGFLLDLLNLFVVFPIWNVFLAYRIFLDYKRHLNRGTYELLYLNSSCLGDIFFGVTYTVLYFECKKHHGDDQQINNALLEKE